MLREILLIYLLFASQVIWGQELKGVVLEKESNEPLIGAHIYIINSLQGTVSDADGAFTVTPPNSYGEFLSLMWAIKIKKLSLLQNRKK